MIVIIAASGCRRTSIEGVIDDLDDERVAAADLDDCGDGRVRAPAADLDGVVTPGCRRGARWWVRVGAQVVVSTASSFTACSCCGTGMCRQHRGGDEADHGPGGEHGS